MVNYTKIFLFLGLLLVLKDFSWWLGGVNRNFSNSNLSFSIAFHSERMSRNWNLECWYLRIEPLLTTFTWIFQMLFNIAMPELILFYFSCQSFLNSARKTVLTSSVPGKKRKRIHTKRNLPKDKSIINVIVLWACCYTFSSFLHTHFRINMTNSI